MDFDTFVTPHDLRILGEVAGSMFLGGIIGYERELHQKGAGLRTHIVVAGASTMFVAFSSQLIRDYGKAFPADTVMADPTRVILAIITGIAFIGAGTVFQSRSPDEGPHGLATAASLLFTAGIGIGIAVEKFFISIALTFLLVAVNWGLGLLKRRTDSDND